MADKDKIADEKLTDDELDNVAGGKAEEMANDSRFLNSLNGSCDRYGEWKIMFSAGAYNEEIEKAWATVGIKAEVSSGQGGFGKKNKYYLKGNQITQEEARQHAMNVTGHYMTEEDWKW